MASDLKLKMTENQNGTITVSWVDAVNGLTSFRPMAFPGFFLLLIIMIEFNPKTYRALTDYLGGYDDEIFRTIGLAFLVGVLWVLWRIVNVSMERNCVIFSTSEIRHEDNVFPTERVTRIDYGHRASLLGNPNLDGSVIRMWIDDAQVFTLSNNNWDAEANHSIHHALTKALEAIRNFDKQQEHEQNFGVVDDDGMPDY